MTNPDTTNPQLPGSARTYLTLAALNGFLTVALGAFGAHGLKHSISDPLLEVYQTGATYQGFHTLGLALVGLLLAHAPSNRWLRASGNFTIVGIVLFSGSLYLLALTGMKQLGMITPVGGVSLLVGWLLLALAVFRSRQPAR